MERAEVVVGDGKLRYKKAMEDRELSLEHLVWAYLWQEAAPVSMSCGSLAAEPGRVIVVERDGRKECFQFGSMQEARELLLKLQAAKPGLAVGYTEENQRRFQAEGGKNIF